MKLYPQIFILFTTLKILFLIVACECLTYDSSYDYSYDDSPHLGSVPSSSGIGRSPHPSPSMWPPSMAPTPHPSPSQWPIFMAPSEAPLRQMSFPAEPPFAEPVGGSGDGLQVGFYAGKCVGKKLDVEEIIASEVKAQFDADPSLLPAILRMQFHDCFVRGCDASILIDGSSTEKTGGPNHSVRGYDFIEAIKLLVEVLCPGVVSCADIIAVATKVLIKLGGGPDIPVQTGRRDGLVSIAGDAQILPSPSLAVQGIIAAFAKKNFTVGEMVVLLGCHTVGIAHCGFIRNRLYPGSIQFDPQMDPGLHTKLTQICPEDSLSTNFTFLDQNPKSSNRVDNSYYTQIINQRGVLLLDQALARDPKTRGFVQQLSLNATLFNVELAKVVIKLQAVDVLTGNQGEIRKVCSRVN